MGGIGKTQVVKQYAYKIIKQGFYDFIWWFDVECALNEGLLNLVKVISKKLENIPFPSASKENVQEWLENILTENFNSLLIFDNAKSFEQIKNYLPLSSSSHLTHILITSRDSNFETLKNIDLEQWPVDNAIAYIKNITK